jgi:hypothetical protein
MSIAVLFYFILVLEALNNQFIFLLSSIHLQNGMFHILQKCISRGNVIKFYGGDQLRQFGVEVQRFPDFLCLLQYALTAPASIIV